MGWLDREWSSQALADNQQGWDWFSLHLNDGHKLMVYQLRHDDGEHWISGTWISPDGSNRKLDHETVDLNSTAVREIAVAGNRVRALPMEWRLAPLLGGRGAGRGRAGCRRGNRLHGIDRLRLAIQG
jgi:predicted secreted hydrolase